MSKRMGHALSSVSVCGALMTVPMLAGGAGFKREFPVDPDLETTAEILDDINSQCVKAFFGGVVSPTAGIVEPTVMIGRVMPFGAGPARWVFGTGLSVSGGVKVRIASPRCRVRVPDPPPVRITATVNEDGHHSWYFVTGGSFHASTLLYIDSGGDVDFRPGFSLPLVVRYEYQWWSDSSDPEDVGRRNRLFVRLGTIQSLLEGPPNESGDTSLAFLWGGVFGLGAVFSL